MVGIVPPKREVILMRINNVNALWAWRNLQNTQRLLSTTMETLITGSRIPRASFDASGLTISQRLKALIRGYETALNNIYNGIGLLRTAEGGLGSITEALQRMRELAVQSSSGTLTEAERAALQQEFEQLRQGISEVVKNTNYNTINVLSGEVQNMQIQTGPTEGETLSITIPNMSPEALGLNELDISTIENAQSAITRIDEILENVSQVRSNVGSWMNRLEYAARNIGNYYVNTMSSLSTLEDADIARRILELTRLQIIRQSNLAMLGQANINNQSVLRLFTG